jgi:hypothetical protein
MITMIETSQTLQAELDAENSKSRGLSRRRTCHLTSGAPKQHTIQVHGEKLTRVMLVDRTTIHEDRKLEYIFGL